MQTVTVDIINDKALNLLQDLELLKLIRVRKDTLKDTAVVNNWIEKYKGSMSKQPIEDIDKQLNELRKEWE